MSIKSLIAKTKIDKAKRLHYCQANKKHIIVQGQMRLNVKEGRNWKKYCEECINKMLEKLTCDISFLKEEISKNKMID